MVSIFVEDREDSWAPKAGDLVVPFGAKNDSVWGLVLTDNVASEETDVEIDVNAHVMVMWHYRMQRPRCVKTQKKLLAPLFRETST